MKAAQILQSFTNEELNQFRLFLRSPFFNSDDNLKKLFSIMVRYYPTFSSRQFTKEKVFQKVFPKHDYHDGKWRNLLSKMVKALEQYMAISEMKTEGWEEQKLLAKAYGRRKLNTLFHKQTEHLLEELAEGTKKDHQALLDRSLQAQLLYYHPSGNQIKNRHLLLQAGEDAREYFKALELKMGSDELVFQQIVGTERQEKSVEKKEPVYLGLYRLVHSFLSQGTYEAFDRAKIYLMSNVEQLTMHDQKFGLFHLINFCIRQYNLAVPGYGRTIFELYQYGLERNILMENGVLSERTFDNILAISFNFMHFEWSLKFIEDYHIYLPEPIRERAKTEAYGQFHFYKKEFQLALEFFDKVNHDTITSSLIRKSYVSRCYFEIFLTDHSYYDLLISYTTAFERLVKRQKKLEENRKQGCINFLKFLRMMAHPILNGNWNEETKELLKKEIDVTNPIIVKKWLLNKLDEI